jgi:hypothetical protein
MEEGSADALWTDACEREVFKKSTHTEKLGYLCVMRITLSLVLA